ncbi:MAG: glycosyltransferase [Alphaproteobacteria bacterium]|nr:glycosyltransferase [Alphaproteobacteria bacterium]
MWFVWLLRGDLRRGRPVDSAEEQREFVAWWLLWGHQIYCPGWRAEAVHLSIAMEPVAVAGGRLPRLLRPLYESSSQLRSLFDIETAAGVAEYRAWYDANGARELGVALGRADNTEPALTLTGGEAGLQARLPASLAPLLAGAAARSAVAAGGKPEREAPAPERRKPATVRAGSAAIGANLVGFAFGELGLGEDVRMLSLALDAAGIDHVVLDVPTLAQTRSADRSVAKRVFGRLRFPVTIFCLSPFDTADFYTRGRNDLFSAEYNIGYWPWELPEMPRFWHDAYGLVDEVWANSRYTAAAFQRSSPVPVHVLPPCVEIPDAAAIHGSARRLRQSRNGRFQFLYPFDRNSYLARKNPAAAMDAFRRAFPSGERSVELLLRINGEQGNDRDVGLLRSHALDDKRIVVHEGTLPKAAALAVLAAADCLVSPHRAEGFGRNIAEAILLQVPVLATGFGGCIDFLRSEEAIDWRPVPVGEEDYPHAAGQWWADPDTDHLARRMREIHELRTAQGARGPSNTRRDQFRAVYSAAAAGARYAARLHEIYRARRGGRRQTARERRA